MTMTDRTGPQTWQHQTWCADHASSDSDGHVCTGWVHHSGTDADPFYLVGMEPGRVLLGEYDTEGPGAVCCGDMTPEEARAYGLRLITAAALAEASQ